MNLIIIGLGYVGYYQYKKLSSKGSPHKLLATTRNPQNKKGNEYPGLNFINFNNHETLSQEIASDCTHLLVTAPPEPGGIDPFLNFYEKSLIKAKNLVWVGYISTTSVYGDHQGRWVDESSHCKPTSQQARDRLAVEDQYLRLYYNHQVPVHIFRSSGIYGPGRSVFDRLDSPNFRPIRAPEHLFSRIHVEDIAALLEASMYTPTPGEIFNLGDRQPASSYEVAQYACTLMGRTPPPVIELKNAQLSERMADFYRDNKRVKADKILKTLNMELMYPTYKEGLEAIYRNS